MHLFRKSALPVILSATLLSGCATQGKPPPTISLDEPVQAPAAARTAQAGGGGGRARGAAVAGAVEAIARSRQTPSQSPEPADEKVRVSRANAEARVAPTREGYVNAIQVWPFTDGALYQVYAAVGRVTVDFAAAGRGTGDGGRRRYRALDRGRHVQRQRCRSARERAGQADSLGPEDQSRHHHQPPHLPAGAVFDGKDVDGIGVLGVPEGPDAGLAAPGAGRPAPLRRWTPACRWRTCASATRSAAAIRRGSRCAPSTTARRSISSSPPASRKASCRRCS
jgi:hypothetical protein